MLRNFTIRNRMYFILSVMTLLFLGMAFTSFSNTWQAKEAILGEFKEVMLDDQKSRLQTVVHSIALALGEAVKDVPDPEERMRIIREMVDPIRFEEDKSGYFFVFDGTFSIAVPPKKSIQGKDLKNLLDGEGKPFIVHIMKTAHAGGGFIEYVFDKPGQGMQPKLSYAMMIPHTRYHIGTGVYIDNIDASMAALSGRIDALVHKKLILISVFASLCFFGLILPICLSIIRSIAKPLSEVNALAGRLAKGDLNLSFNSKGKDEISELQATLNQTTASLREMVKGIASGIGTLFSSSGNISDISGQISQGSEDTARRSGNATAASESMSTAMASIAAAMEEASSNVAMVANAAEQMTENIDDIVRNTEKAGDITGEAVNRAKSASDNIEDLDNAAAAIGKVTEAITEISEQTNLLALNATIEAARAGEAGKGFAVVAGEIKELAKQTSDSTAEIKERISAIQGSTMETVAHIGQVTEIIGEVNAIVSEITAVVKSQADTTREIAGNVGQASLGIQEVTENVASSSASSQEIVQDITDVNSAAGEMNQSSSKLSRRAEELSSLAEQLKGMAGQFNL